MSKDALFRRGDLAIRHRLLELARDRGTVCSGVERHDELLGGEVVSYVFTLTGTSISISLRAREVRLAAERATRLRYIEPRLASIFETTWWARSVVLLRRELG